jgi:hypothetical protein
MSISCDILRQAPSGGLLALDLSKPMRLSPPSPLVLICASLALSACGVAADEGYVPDSAPLDDPNWPDASDLEGSDAGTIADGGGITVDGGDSLDGGAPIDASLPPDANSGIISGGSCLSGSPGASAYRVRFINAGGSAQVVYEGNGLPDPTDHTGVFGYQIGFTSSFVDTFLAQGGLQLNSSSFVDIELSTIGVTTIHSATLSIYGRSYNTTTSGSFSWQTFSGIGNTPSNLVANSAPYEWYSGDMLSEIDPNDDSVLLRIKAGPSSGSLAVNQIELCLDAD